MNCMDLFVLNLICLKIKFTTANDLLVKQLVISMSIDLHILGYAHFSMPPTISVSDHYVFLLNSLYVSDCYVSNHHVS